MLLTGRYDEKQTDGHVQASHLISTRKKLQQRDGKKILANAVPKFSLGPMQYLVPQQAILSRERHEHRRVLARPSSPLTLAPPVFDGGKTTKASNTNSQFVLVSTVSRQVRRMFHSWYALRPL